MSRGCRASIPVFTCILAVIIENKVPTRGEAVSLAVLTLGVMVAVWEGTVTGSPRAIMLCLGGTLSNAAMMSTSGKVLSEKVDVLRLTFYTAPISLLALLPALYLREVGSNAFMGPSLQSTLARCLCLRLHFYCLSVFERWMAEQILLSSPLCMDVCVRPPTRVSSPSHLPPHPPACPQVCSYNLTVFQVAVRADIMFV